MRIEAELLAKMRQLAREENRTLTNFVETVLRQRLTGGVAHSAPTPEAPLARAAKQIKDKPTHAA